MGDEVQRQFDAAGGVNGECWTMPVRYGEPR
jgi:hypothetical protein